MFDKKYKKVMEMLENRAQKELFLYFQFRNFDQYLDANYKNPDLEKFEDWEKMKSINQKISDVHLDRALTLLDLKKQIVKEVDKDHRFFFARKTDYNIGGDRYDIRRIKSL